MSDRAKKIEEAARVLVAWWNLGVDYTQGVECIAALRAALSTPAPEGGNVSDRAKKIEEAAREALAELGRNKKVRAASLLRAALSTPATEGGDDLPPELMVRCVHHRSVGLWAGCKACWDSTPEAAIERMGSALAPPATGSERSERTEGATKEET